MPKIDVNEIDTKLLDTIVPGIIEQKRAAPPAYKPNLVLNNPSDLSDKMPTQTAE